MKPTDKKFPHANVAWQRPHRPAAHAQQFKPAVAQAKSALPAHALRHPVAPPVYAPPKPSVAQAKAAGPAQMKSLPVAPPVYRPQPAPKVLQAKAAAAGVRRQDVDASRPAAAGRAVQPCVQLKHASSRQPLQSPRPNVIVRSLVIQRAAEDFPPLGTVVSKREQKAIYAVGHASATLGKQQEEKARQAAIARLAEIKDLSRREKWWELLYLVDGSTSSVRVRAGYGTVETKPVHVTVVKANTTNVDFKQDSVATIVDKILGAANVADSVHTTMELKGVDHADNPRYYRNGDSPNCSGSQRNELKGLLDDFVTEATTVATNKKTQLNP